MPTGDHEVTQYYVWQHASQKSCMELEKIRGDFLPNRQAVVDYLPTTHEFPKGRVQRDILEQTNMN
jgi:hypothetical protein